MAYDGEHVTRIGAGGGSVGFGSASGVSFREGLLAVLWDRGRLVSLQRIGEQRLRPLRLGPVPGRHDVAQSRHVVVDEDVVAVYDGATRLLRTYDVDTRRLVTHVRLPEEFAFAELAAVEGGVAVFTNAIDEPPISLVDLSSGQVAALAVEGIDRNLPAGDRNVPGPLADADDEGVVISYSTRDRRYPGRVRYIPREEVLRLLRAASE